jgi:hypothetical protein
VWWFALDRRDEQGYHLRARKHVSANPVVQLSSDARFYFCQISIGGTTFAAFAHRRADMFQIAHPPGSALEEHQSGHPSTFKVVCGAMPEPKQDAREHSIRLPFILLVLNVFIIIFLLAIMLVRGVEVLT